MALVKGTNCGFVLVAPSADPAVTGGTIDGYSKGALKTDIQFPVIITELGWYCSSNPDVGQDWEMAVYSHDSAVNKPLAIQGTRVGPVALTAGAGWKSVSGLSLLLVPGIYWLCLQLDNSVVATNDDFQLDASETAWASAAGSLTLPDPWVGVTSLSARLIAYYAVYLYAGRKPWVKFFLNRLPSSNFLL